MFGAAVDHGDHGTTVCKSRKMDDFHSDGPIILPTL